MAKLPAFQFYPGDWMKDPALRRCSPAARGAWIDLICLMFESDTPGILRSNGAPWTKDEAARAVGVTLDEIEELISKGVMRVARRSGALWSKRLLRDEITRRRKARSGKKGGEASKPEAKPKQAPKQIGSKPEANTQAKRGSSSSSSFSSSERREEDAPSASPAALPPPPSVEMEEPMPESEFDVWCADVLAAYNETMAIPGTPWVLLEDWTHVDRKNLERLFRESFRREYRGVFSTAVRSKLLTQGMPSGWKPPYSWVLEKWNYRKILAGDYLGDNAQSAPAQTSKLFVPKREVLP